MQGQYPLIVAELADKNVDKEKVRLGILKHCKKKLEERGQPCDVVFEDKIPLTLIGKNDVKTLTEKYIDYDYTNH